MTGEGDSRSDDSRSRTHLDVGLGSLVGERSRLPWIAAGVLLVALLGVGMYATWSTVHDLLQDMLASNLSTIQAADVVAIEQWISREQAAARRWATRPAVRKAAQELAALARSSERPEADLFLHSEALGAFRLGIANAVEQEQHLGLILTSRDGLVMATDAGDHLVGREVPASSLASLRRVFDGEALVRPPQRSLAEMGIEAPNLLLVTVPVRAPAAPGGDVEPAVVAALSVLIDADVDFQRILSHASTGETGETYAFDAEGGMLSASRFAEELAALGIVPTLWGGRSVPSIPLRDPGGDRTRGFVPDPSVPIEGLPLTKAVASAVAGGRGIDVEGYPDYRGVPVIGAWTWLPEYEMGVATEMDVAEFERVLLPLKITFGALGAAILATALALAWSQWRVHIYRSRIGDIQVLGQYHLEEQIGEGGMGKVYRAQHQMLLRPSCVKVIKGNEVTQGMKHRFELEVKRTAELAHPNTIAIYDYGRTRDDFFYYAMEYLPGVTLQRLLAFAGPLPAARVVHLVRQVCRALREAHAVGLLHRDIKPANIMVNHMGGEGDVVKVLDFGLVKDLEPRADALLSDQNVVSGTTAYVAPERFAGATGDGRSDLYAVGVVAFNLLTGKDLFDGISSVEIVYHATTTPARRPSELVDTDVPADIEAIVMDLLEKDPARRPQDAQAVLDRLEALDSARSWSEADAVRWWIENEAALAASGGGARRSSLAEDSTVLVHS